MRVEIIMCINIPAPKLINWNIARNSQTPTEVKRKTMKYRMRLASSVSQLVCNIEVLVFCKKYARARLVSWDLHVHHVIHAPIWSRDQSHDLRADLSSNLCSHKSFFTCCVSMLRRCPVWPWLSEFSGVCIELFHAFSLHYFHGWTKSKHGKVQ